MLNGLQYKFLYICEDNFAIKGEGSGQIYKAAATIRRTTPPEQPIHASSSETSQSTMAGTKSVAMAGLVLAMLVFPALSFPEPLQYYSQNQLAKVYEGK